MNVSFYQRAEGHYIAEAARISVTSPLALCAVCLTYFFDHSRAYMVRGSGEFSCDFFSFAQHVQCAASGLGYDHLQRFIMRRLLFPPVKVRIQTKKR